MILAELELFHSRPVAPTRRVSLGTRLLPADPAPGPAGVLLGGILAAVAGEIDPDLEADLLRLTLSVEEGRRIVQPCLRHRLQIDQVGLSRSRFRLIRNDENELSYDFDDTSCTPLAGALGAIYGAGMLSAQARIPVMDSVRRGLRWHGDMGPELIRTLSGRTSGAALDGDALADPVGWARKLLGFDDEEGDGVPERKAVQRKFRDALRDAHPDHGAEDDEAADRIAELTEARRILLG